ncbi:MAG: SDR family oxidoreductase [Pseudomonadota bacterium]
MKSHTQYSSLEGEAVLVTGGASGIGAAMVSAFAAQGARVGFIDNDTGAAFELIEEVNQDCGIKPWFREVDVTDVSHLKDSIHDAAKELGPFLCLINNVANDNRESPVQVTPESWQRCMAVNLDCAFFASQAVYEYMRQRGKGSIINLSSINALLGPADMPGYVTAKAGLIGMTKSLARDFGNSGIRVNAIMPGWVATKRQLDHWLTPEQEKKWLDNIALKDRIMPEDVANLATFLASDNSRMITGQSLTIDAGRT